MGTMGTSGLEAIEPRQAAASMDRGELHPLRVEAAGTKFDIRGRLAPCGTPALASDSAARSVSGEAP